jgi:hypothetical protein
MEFAIKILPYIIPTAIYIVALYLMGVYYRKIYRPVKKVQDQQVEPIGTLKPVINIIYDTSDDISQHVGDIADIALNFKSVYFSTVSSTANLPADADSVFVKFETVNINNLFKISEL